MGGIDYATTEQDTGLKWIGGETVYQKTIDTGALPDSTTKNVVHGITTIDIMIDLRGTAEEPMTPAFIPLPRAKPSSPLEVALGADGTNIILQTVADFSIYTTSFVTVTYTKV